MKPNEKKITVLMSVYNDSKFVKHSVLSILNQTYKDFEFLIIDDGSEDDTESIINDFKDSRIVYKKIRHSGLASALNFGIKNSTGDLIARIDADDLNTASRLHAQIDFINKNPGYDVVSSWSVYFKEPKKILFLLKTPVDDPEIKKFLNLHNPVNHSSVIFNKRKIIENGGYNENFECYEDFELWFRLKDQLKFKIIPEYLTYTRLHPLSMSHKKKKDKIHSMLIKNALLNSELEKDADSIKYWKETLFRIEYFYGDKRKSRKYLPDKLTAKNALEYLNTFLPEDKFNDLLELRLRYRIESKFKNLSVYEKELEKLLK